MEDNRPLKIVKPTTGFMEKFRSKRPPTIAGVETLLTPLPILRLGDVRDFFRLHPDEENYWSPELYFVNVPIRGVSAFGRLPLAYCRGAALARTVQQ